MRNVIYFLVWVFYLFLSPQIAGQQVRINEIMSSNSSVLADEDGDFSDWIELTNTGADTINLKNWGLSDDYDKPFKWIFPEVKINPGGYLLIWASGKDRRPGEGEWVHGVVREVYANISGTSVSSLTQHVTYPEAPTSRMMRRDYFEAPVNEANNYGQRIHGYLQPPVSGSYTFWISSDDNGQLWLSDNETTNNIWKIAEVPGWTNAREWNKYAQQRSAPVYLEKGKRYYIRALAKEGTGGDNLAVGWGWPDGTLDFPISGAYLFWPKGELHTNFNISAGGEEVLITNPQGIRMDEITPVAIPSDISYGHAGNEKEMLFFTTPTPAKANGNSGYQEVLPPPVFSHKGGFYPGPFSLSLSSQRPGVSVIYTLDGSAPDIKNLSGTSYGFKNQYPKTPGSSAGPMLYRTYRSYLYSAPLQIRDRTPDANQISGISTTYDSSPWYFPSYPVDKAMVVRARAEKQGALPSQVVTQTYFVRSSGANPYSLPVFSIASPEDNLFDFNKGIYVAGTDFEQWRASNPSATADGGVRANYHREGDLWEYPASMEYFTQQGTQLLSQNIGFRIHGNWSNAHPFKSLRIYARSSSGESWLDYPFFKSEKEDKYKRIILRNSGNDIWYTMFRDAAMQEMVSHMNFETQAYQPSVLFINGEYWGIHNIRERIDKYYLAGKFDISEEQVDIVEGNMVVDEGDNRHYTETINYITQYGASQTNHYEYIKTRLDLASYIDYMIAQIFMVNTDWPGNNIKYWRLQTPEFLQGAEPGKDGRWRWLLYDADFTFGIYKASEYSFNMMTFVTQTDGPSWPNPPWSTFLFRKLLENESFKTDFIVRFCDQLNTAFRPAVVKPIIDRMQSTIAPEMTRHIQRWKMPSSLSNWYANVNQMRDFAGLRPSYAREQLRNFFYLPGEYALSIDVSGINQGFVVVNTIPLTKDTRGVDENPYPWQGTYFNGVPLRLEAVALSGYEFVRWESSTGYLSDPVLKLKPGKNQNFKAVFQKTDRAEQLVHYWNFNSSEKPLNPTFTKLNAGIQAVLPAGNPGLVTLDSGQDFNGINARFDEPAGTHLIVNNPLEVKLLFDIPTTGFSDVRIRYETRRSGQGAGTQIIEYTINGYEFIIFRRITVRDTDPELVVLDFTHTEGVNNNPEFKIRIRFEPGNGGTSGNNRFDNFTLEGIPEINVNVPPGISLPETQSSLRVEVFPNPFRSMTTLKLFLNEPGVVNISLFDNTHRKVMTIDHGIYCSGITTWQLDATSLVPGTYLLVCQTSTGMCSQKLIKF